MIKPCEVSCPKCGSDDRNAQYYNKGESKRIYAHDKIPPDEWFTHSVGWAKARADVILMHCRCCHYEWVVEPMS